MDIQSTNKAGSIFIILVNYIKLSCCIRRVAVTTIFKLATDQNFAIYLHLIAGRMKQAYAMIYHGQCVYIYSCFLYISGTAIYSQLRNTAILCKNVHAHA